MSQGQINLQVVQSQHTLIELIGCVYNVLRVVLVALTLIDVKFVDLSSFMIVGLTDASSYVEMVRNLLHNVMMAIIMMEMVVVEIVKYKIFFVA